MQNWIINKYYKLRNFIKWLPIIWNDQQWDYYFLFPILKHKLSCMEEFFNSEHTSTVTAEKKAKEIKVCINLLDRLQKNDYYNLSGGTNLDKKWGELDFSIEGTTLSIRRQFVRTETEQSKYSGEFSLVCAHEEELMIQDLNYLCKLINRNLFKWWD